MTKTQKSYLFNYDDCRDGVAYFPHGFAICWFQASHCIYGTTFNRCAYYGNGEGKKRRKTEWISSVEKSQAFNTSFVDVLHKYKIRSLLLRAFIRKDISKTGTGILNQEKNNIKIFHSIFRLLSTLNIGTFNNFIICK